MSELTWRAEYPLGAVGPRIEALAVALATLPANPERTWEPWLALSVPGQLRDAAGAAFGVGFVARCRYDGRRRGWVLLAAYEEQIAQTPKPFQQAFLGFVDCRREPPPTLNPLELFDPYARRDFARSPMWTIAPARDLVSTTFDALNERWTETTAPFVRIAGTA